ncbi:hypothetical protein [Salinispora arenicola]|uniref:hypothetical protein n=1 Tax=Salinispora arenicola TaxID=168697 RepID=UPI0027DC004E|nr:hypothetical protein [Salinispora arenicola]
MDWSLADRPLRLASGAAVIPTADGFLLVTPTEDFLTVDVEPERRQLVRALLAADVTPAHGGPRGTPIPPDCSTPWQVRGSSRRSRKGPPVRWSCSVTAS